MAMCDLDKDGFVTEDELMTSQRLRYVFSLLQVYFPMDIIS